MRKGLFIVGVLSNKICDFLLANKVALGRVPNFCNKIYHNTTYFLLPGLWFKGHQIIRIMDIIRGVFLEEIRYVCGYWLINWVESHQNLHILGEVVRGIKKNLFIIHQFRSSIRIDLYIRWFRIFLDFKVSRYCEGYSFWSVWGPSILVRAFWNFKRKVLKYTRNCSLLITNFVKPLTIHL